MQVSRLRSGVARTNTGLGANHGKVTRAFVHVDGIQQPDRAFAVFRTEDDDGVIADSGSIPLKHLASGVTELAEVEN